MVQWLKENFQIYNIDGIEYISWDNKGCSINYIIQKFGDEKLSKDEMLQKAPTDAWRNIINRWDELGKFNMTQ